MAKFEQIRLLDDEDELLSSKTFGITENMIIKMIDVEALDFLKKNIFENITEEQKIHLMKFENVGIWDPSETPLGIGKQFMSYISEHNHAIKITGENQSSLKQREEFYNNEYKNDNDINITRLSELCGQNLFGQALQSVLEFYKSIIDNNITAQARHKY